MTNHRIAVRARATLPGWLLCLNLLLFGTFWIYAGNAAEFPVFYEDAFEWGFLGLLLLSGFVLALPVLLLPARLAAPWVALMLLCGVLSWVHGGVLYRDTGLLGLDQPDFSNRAYLLLDAGLWLVGGAWFLHRRRWIYRNGWSIALVLIAVQGLAMMLHDYHKPQDRLRIRDMPDSMPVFSTQSNVVHLVLDAYQANYFEELLPRFEEEWNGFTFFRDALAPSEITYLSLPAALSGRAFDNQISISEYLEATLGGDNLFSLLHQEGYRVDFATPTWWISERAPFDSYFRIPRPYEGRHELAGGTMWHLVDLSLFRQAPYFLKSSLYNRGLWRLTGNQGSDPAQQFSHFAHLSFLQDFTDRSSRGDAQPRYKFMHLVTPHAPLVSAPDCSFAGENRERAPQSVRDQSRCVMKAVIAFLDRMRELGVYDNSTIIIHGDHGGSQAFPMLAGNGTPTNSHESLDRVWGNPLPLVLIKPPANQGPLQISDRPVSLVDIPATVASFLDIPHEFPGHAMFSREEPPAVRHFWRGGPRRNEAWQQDRFDWFEALEVRGSVYDVEAWRSGKTSADMR